MNCDHPGCKRADGDLTHDRSVWPPGGGLKVEYFCDEHAPADAEPIDESDA